MNEIDPTSVWSLKPEHENTKLYHKWSYDPVTDSVSIDGNEVGEDHGYAYRIGGGWRILDTDHKKIKDFYIFPKVLEALKGETSPEPEVGEFDFDQLHYGQPLPVNNQVELGEVDGVN